MPGRQQIILSRWDSNNNRKYIVTFSFCFEDKKNAINYTPLGAVGFQFNIRNQHIMV